jgi:hypothetical protein
MKHGAVSVILAALIILAAPLAADAQPPKKVPRIAYVQPACDGVR